MDTLFINFQITRSSKSYRILPNFSVKLTQERERNMLLYQISVSTIKNIKIYKKVIAK